MESINITSARQNLYQLVNETNESHRPIHILGKQGNAVLLSEADFRSMQETIYLSSVPGLMDSLKQGLSEPLDGMVNADELEW